jgi:hypothetical protein
MPTGWTVDWQTFDHGAFEITGDLVNRLAGIAIGVLAGSLAAPGIASAD